MEQKKKINPFNHKRMPTYKRISYINYFLPPHYNKMSKEDTHTERHIKY